MSFTEKVVLLRKFRTGDPGKVSFIESCPLFGISFIRGSTVVHTYVVRLARLHTQLTGVGRVAAIFSSSTSELSQEMWPHAVVREQNI